MKTFVGIDLGSTTTKAVLLDENSEVIGRGITNSRSNYATAARVAERGGAHRRPLHAVPPRAERGRRQERRARRVPRRARARLPSRAVPRAARRSRADLPRPDQGRALRQASKSGVKEALDRGLQASARGGAVALRARRQAQVGLLPRHRRLALSRPCRGGRARGGPALRAAAQRLRQVDHRRGKPAAGRRARATSSAARSPACSPRTASVKTGSTDVPQTIEDTLGIDLEETYLVGTGYGRVTLPFSKEHIRSEILCHGLGAHMMYPKTRTVLDIGGQDTKGIQVDANGIVENFQMNDRCAAGCGRYLGYIADEMNMGLHELGPHGDEVGPAGAHQLDLHGVRRRRAARPPVARREARGHPGRPAPRHHPARDLDHLALGRRHRRVHLHRRRRQERGGGARAAQAHQGELRRRHHQHQPGVDLHRRARRGRVRAPRHRGQARREATA